MTKHIALTVLAASIIWGSAFAASNTSSNILMMREGKVVAPAGQSAVHAAATSSGAKLLIWSDKKYYLLGEHIRLRALGLADGAEHLQFSIYETFVNGEGKVAGTDYYTCECGDSNGGFVPSLSSFNFITLLDKKAPSFKIGRYDFTVVVKQYNGNGSDPALDYQTTNLSVFVLNADGVRDSGPIVIDQTSQVVGQNGMPELLLTGTFPKDVPLHYFVGAAPYYGAFTSEPSVISTDGVTLRVPGLAMSRMESRVILMMPDGSQSTISSASFIPLAQLPVFN